MARNTGFTMKRTGDWAKVARMLSAGGARLKRAVDQATAKEAHHLRNEIVKGIRDQAPGGKRFKPLGPLTLAARRLKGIKSTKALLVHGDLRNGIVVVKKRSGYFIGVLRTAKSRDGENLANLADIHEYGRGPYPIKLTPKMRAWLGMLIEEAGRANQVAKKQGGRDAKGRFTKAKVVRVKRAGKGLGQRNGILMVKIPARPFMGPVFAQYNKNQKKVVERFLKRVGDALGGDWRRMTSGL